MVRTMNKDPNFVLGKTIDAGSEVSIDIHKLVTTRMVIQANSGAGKSQTMRRMIEKSFGHAQIIVIDPSGEYLSLAEKLDILIVSNEGDLPVRVDTAEMLALKLRDIGISAVIDLSDLKPLPRKEYVKLFLSSLMMAKKAPGRPCIVAIDESDMFAPQSRESQATEAVVDLCVRGRKHGLCAVLAVMRLSQLHKDAAAQCNNYLIGRTSLDVDIKRVIDILGFQRTRERVATLKLLKPGQFYFFGPSSSSEDVSLLKVGDVQTYHPDARVRSAKPVSTKSVAVTKALSQLADLDIKAEEKRLTEATLRQNIQDLKAQLRLADKPRVDPKVITELSDQNKILRADLRAVHARNLFIMTQLKNPVSKLNELIESEKAQTLDALEELPMINSMPNIPTLSTKSALYKPLDVQIEDSGGDKSLPKRALDILREIVRVYPESITKKKIGLLVGLRINTGNFSNLLVKLRTAEYINRNTPSGLLLATDDGIQAAGEVNPLPTDPRELRELWKGILKGRPSEMIDALIHAGGELSKNDLADKIGLIANTGNFSNLLVKLRKSQVATTNNGMVRLSDEFISL